VEGNILISWVTINFSRRTLLHGVSYFTQNYDLFQFISLHSILTLVYKKHTAWVSKGLPLPLTLYNPSTSQHRHFSPEDGDSMFLRNVCIYLRVNTASESKGTSSCNSAVKINLITKGRGTEYLLCPWAVETSNPDVCIHGSVCSLVITKFDNTFLSTLPTKTRTTDILRKPVPPSRRHHYHFW
jgi:hypothetical protein